MGWLLFVVYMIVAAGLCGLYIYLSSKVQSIDHDFDIVKKMIEEKK